MFEYSAIVKDCYDGDTITVDIDLGFGVWLRGQKLRLYGVDTPEARPNKTKKITKAMAEEGKKVASFVRGIIDGKKVAITTHKDEKEKFGRWLASVQITGKMLFDAGISAAPASAIISAIELTQEQRASHIYDLSKLLLDTGRAKPMVY